MPKPLPLALAPIPHSNMSLVSHMTSVSRGPVMECYSPAMPPQVLPAGCHPFCSHDGVVCCGWVTCRRLRSRPSERSQGSRDISGRGRSCLYLATAQETVSSQMLLSGSVWLQPTAIETQLYSMWDESDYGMVTNRGNKMILNIIAQECHQLCTSQEKYIMSYNVRIVQTSAPCLRILGFISQPNPVFICLHKTDTTRNYHLPKRSRTGIHIKKQMVITEQRDWGPIL